MRYLLIACAALALGGCTMATPERDWPISERWKVSETASPECLSAARRASKFCLDKSLPSDIWGSYTSECTKAQWDYARSCR
jgi:hypothetical protein